MCGKFTQLATWAEVVAFSQPLGGWKPEDATVIVATPMRMARIIVLDSAGARTSVEMRWGFADKNAATPARPKHMHARAETVDTLPTFAHAFAHHRGILLVDTFNEGEALPSGKTRQWTITPKHDHPVAIAVVFEEWRNGEASLLTFVQVTTPASALIAPVTDRMPAILRPEDWATWLGETDASPAEVKALLRTFEDEGEWTIAPQPAPARTPRQPPPQADLF